MIKKLRWRFIAIAMYSMIFVTLILVGAINIINQQNLNNEINEMLTLISENDGRIPSPGQKDAIKHIHPPEEKITPETQFKTRYFVVKTNSNGVIDFVETKNIAAVSQEQAAAYAREILEENKTEGLYDIYSYKVSESENGKMIVFLDSSQQIVSKYSLLVTSITVAGISVAIVFLLVFFLSKKAIKPFVESIEKQKQFITDASHEIKTPITIISANVDLLKMDYGENKWLKSIKNQTERLTSLTNGLTLLAKSDEMQVPIHQSTFSMSNLVRETAESFKILAEADNKTFNIKVQPDINIYGDKENLKQVISILSENAIKHSNKNGIINLSLSIKGKYTVLELYNTCNSIKQEEINRIFDRFYRADSSRSRGTGGYGIGLSIAKAIVEMHKGKISAKTYDEKSIIFTAIF